MGQQGGRAADAERHGGGQAAAGAARMMGLMDSCEECGECADTMHGACIACALSAQVQWTCAQLLHE